MASKNGASGVTPKNCVPLAGTMRCVFASLMPLAVALYATAQVQFLAPTNYAVGTTPVATVVGDFNGDGKLDLAVANNGSGDVSILLGNGDGTFQNAVSYPAGSTPFFIAAGDFNRDGKLDLAVANGSANTVSILLGNGDGTFQTPIQINANNTAYYVAVGDFNNDKKLDLYVSNGNPSPGLSYAPQQISTLFGNGDGTFQPPVQTSVQGFAPPGYTPHIDEVAALGDFNRDGYLDVALSEYWGSLASQFGGYLIVLLGNGDGTFQQPAYYPFGPFDDAFVTWGVVAGDFNGDGKIDLASSGLTGMFVWLGNGDGTFNFTPNPSSPYGNYGGLYGAAAVADLNNDGKLDLIAIETSPSYISTLQWGLGYGDGTFQGLPGNYTACTPASNCMPLPSSFATQARVSPPAVGDFNGDKLPDVASALYSANSIDVFLNATPPSFATFPLTVTVAGNYQGGIVSSTPAAIFCNISCSANFLPGTTVTLTATPNAGSYFTGWSGACSGTGATCTVTMNTTQSVTATFPGFPQLNVTFAGNGGGTVTSSPAGINCGANGCSGNFPPGTTVTLTATSNAGSNFTGWSGACSGTNACSVTMNGDQSATATFSAQDFSLTPASTALTVQPGAQATDVLTLAGVNGPFASAIQLTCSVAGPAPMPTCSLSPTSVTPGASSATSTLTVTAPASGAQLRLAPPQFGKFVYAMSLPLIFGMSVAARSKKHRPGQWISCCALLLLFMLQIACGGSSNRPPPTNYTVTITGTSGAIQHTTQVAVTVQ